MPGRCEYSLVTLDHADPYSVKRSRRTHTPREAAPDPPSRHTVTHTHTQSRPEAMCSWYKARTNGRFTHSIEVKRPDSVGTPNGTALFYPEAAVSRGTAGLDARRTHSSQCALHQCHWRPSPLPCRFRPLVVLLLYSANCMRRRADSSKAHSGRPPVPSLQEQQAAVRMAMNCKRSTGVRRVWLAAFHPGRWAPFVASSAERAGARSGAIS